MKFTDPLRARDPGGCESPRSRETERTAADTPTTDYAVWLLCTAAAAVAAWALHAGWMHSILEPLYWQAITALARLTGVRMLLNTSLNQNEPIVLRLEEALDCFLRTQTHVIVMGRYALERRGH
jgi:hypothetical protein